MEDIQDRKMELAKLRKVLEENTVFVYLLLILSILPLYFHDFYFDITEAKYYFVKNTTIICGIVYLIFHNISREQIKRVVCTKPFLFYSCFLIFGVISVLLSKYPVEAFFGNTGRYKGCFIYLIYGIGLVMIAMEGRVKIKLISFMELSAIFCGVLAILNHYTIDLFGFYTELREDQHLSFTSTFGNIGIFGEYISVMLVMSGMFFCISKKRNIVAWIHLITYEVCLAALLVNNADGSFLSVFFFFICAPLLLMAVEELQRYFLLLVLFFGTSVLYGVLGNVLPNEKTLNGICLMFRNRFLECALASIVLLFFFYFLPKAAKKNWWNFRVLKKGYGIVLIFFVVCIISFTIYTNVKLTGNPGYGIQKYFYISETWGTYRGYVWKLTLDSFGKLPFWKKMIGVGPDTLYYLYQENYVETSYQITYFDNAHNMYLQILAGHGVLGLISWLGWGISSILSCAKKVKENRVYLVVLAGILAYAVNGAVGLNTIHVSALIVALIGISYCEVERKNSL